MTLNTENQQLKEWHLVWSCEWLLYTLNSFLPQIPINILISFAKALEAGYSKHKNPYHNSIHAADVTQTVHAIMIHTGMMVRDDTIPQRDKFSL